MILPLRALLAMGWALQWAVAFCLLRGRPAGPFWSLTAALLALNGWCAAWLAVVGRPPEIGDRAFMLADMVTGVAILGLGLVALRQGRRDAWDLPARGIALGTAAWAAAILLPGLSPAAYDGFVVARLDWLHTLPAMVGLGLLGFALARRMRDPGATASDGFLALAFVPTVAFHAAYFSFYVADGASRGDVLYYGLPRFLGTLVLLPAFVALLALLAMGGPRRTWSGSLLVVTLGAALLALGSISIYLEEPLGIATIYALQNLVPYVLRPVAVGLARERARVAWLVYDVAAAFVAVAAGKVASMLAFGTSPTRLESPDLAGFGLVFFALPALWLLPRRWAR
ncbi:MAG TPA: hypothetical protein VI796_01380, partial [Candidatus Thermoplasmatota archaeon]|nr:hypothetical protein [Candidatus Thermoplasmatota archaeon]